MRRFALLALFLCSFAHAQEGNLFSSVRPDVMVIVREHPTTAEIVQVTTLADDYPVDLLKSQIAQIGVYLNSSIRGLKIESPSLGTQAKVSFLRAEFATDGLIDREKGVVRISPIVKAFAGAPEPHTVHGIKIAFEGEHTTKKMLRDYPVPNVVIVQGRSSVTPPGIEYQVKLISQDPKLIDIPDEYKAPSNQTAPVNTSSNTSPALLIGLFSLAGLALGALVYLALLRSGTNRKG